MNLLASTFPLLKKDCMYLFYTACVEYAISDACILPIVEGFALSRLLRNVLGSVGGPLITRASPGPMERSPDPVTPLVHQRPSGSEDTPTYSYSYAGLAYWACLLQHEGGGAWLRRAAMP